MEVEGEKKERIEEADGCGRLDAMKRNDTASELYLLPLVLGAAQEYHLPIARTRVARLSNDRRKMHEAPCRGRRKKPADLRGECTTT
jgi:hypothetical protein